MKRTIFKSYGLLSQEEIKQYTEWAIESEKEFHSDDDFIPNNETIMNCIIEDINLGYEDDKNYNLNKPLNNKIIIDAELF